MSQPDEVERSPARADAVPLIIVWLSMVAAAVAVGSQMPAATAYDADISEWFLDRRTQTWDTITAVISGLASTFAVVSFGVAIVAIGLFTRQQAGVRLLVVAMAGEVTMFLTITFFVDRARPDVAHLDPAPPTSSFPSGHVFASFVLWNAVAVLAVRQDWPTLLRRLARIVAIVVPAAVAISRVYRGMHHATDVVASLVLGVIWVLAVIVLTSGTALGSGSGALRTPEHGAGVQGSGLDVEGRVHSTDDELATG